MTTKLPDRDEVLNAIRKAAETLGRPPSRAEFKSASGMTEYHVLKHFPSWREAVHAAGLEPHSANQPLDPHVLLKDWGELVRHVRRIPTRDQYRRDGHFSPGVFEKKFGPWSTIPAKFREFAEDKPDWVDVLALLPLQDARVLPAPQARESAPPSPSHPGTHHSKLENRPTYGNPLDFRGLRHEPVNEQGLASHQSGPSAIPPIETHPFRNVRSV